MVTYVLGAGASVHAGYPLASNLGNELRKWLHATKTSDHEHRIHIDQIHEFYGGLGNIEEILTDLDECLPGSLAATIPTHIRPLLLSGFREATREFFNDIRQRPAPLYNQLARERIKPDDVVVTFNYDMACERELRQTGLWEVGDGYGFSLGLGSIPPSQVKLLKPHGSTNWFGLYFRGRRGFTQFSSVLDSRPTLYFRPDMEFLGYPNGIADPQGAGIHQSSGLSAMIMPTLHKRFYVPITGGSREWEPFWDDIWSQAEQALQSSAKIVIVGYSMPTADERAIELLLKHSNPDAEILVFSGSRTNAICEDFRKSGFQTVISFGQGYFADYLNA